MFEAWSVGIRVSLINHVTHNMGAIIRSLSDGHKEAGLLHAQLNKIKLLATASAGVAGAGFMGLGMIGKTIKPASEYVHQLTLMNQAGMKHQEIVQATEAAWKALSSVPSSSVTENLEAIRDLRMVFGDTGHAMGYMPVLQRVQGILGTVRHGSGSAKHEAYELAKALEMKGSVRTANDEVLGHLRFTNSEFSTQADMIAKAIVASGGKVGASDFLSAFKYGRAATAAWNNDFAYTILPTLIQEMKSAGGSGAVGGPGSSLMSMYAAVIGGTVTQRALAEWQRLGLIKHGTEVFTKDGHLKGIKPGGIMGGDLFQSNPYDWVQKILMPALGKAGVTSEAGVRQTLQYLFPNRTAGFIATQFALQAWKFERDRKLINQAQGLEGYNQLLKNDPMLAKMALAKQWDSLLAILGYQVMPQLIAGAQAGIKTIRGLSQWMHDNEGKTKALVWGFTALSGAMAIGGTLKTLHYGFKALQLILPLVSGGAGMTGGLVGLVGALSGPVGLGAAAIAATVAIGGLIWWLYKKGPHSAEEQRAEGKDYHGWDFGSASASRVNGVRPGGSSKTIQVHSTVNLDGVKLAKVVTNHQASEAERPQYLSGGFDTILAAPAVGY